MHRYNGQLLIYIIIQNKIFTQSAFLVSLLYILVWFDQGD